jgi:hypothetical protein
MATRTFIVREKSYINNKICEVGEMVQYDGKPSANLELYKEDSIAVKDSDGKSVEE